MFRIRKISWNRNIRKFIYGGFGDFKTLENLKKICYKKIDSV